jgi:hypothetical protein
MKMKLFTIYLVLLLPILGYSQFLNVGIGTNKGQYGHSVRQTTYEKGFIIAGKDDYKPFAKRNASIIKTKMDGSFSWGYQYGGNGNDWFNSVREVPFTSTPNLPYGYAAVGMSESFTGNPDAYFVRTDLSGSPLFTFVFGKEGKEEAHCVQYIKDHATGKYGYVLVGQTNSYHHYNNTTDILVVTVGETGSFSNATIIGLDGEDIGYWIEQTNDGGFILVGSTTSKTCTGEASNIDIVAVRLDKNLKVLWNTKVGHRDLGYADRAFGVVENTTDGTFTLTGVTHSFGESSLGDAFLINISSVGALNWMKTYGTKYPEQGKSIHITKTLWGGVEYVVAGMATDEFGNQDAYVFKTDQFGNLKWTSLYGTIDGTEQASEISRNETGYVFTGLTKSSFSNGVDIYLVGMDTNGKTGSDCERKLIQTEKRQAPCIKDGFQQVYVDDLKRVDRSFDKVVYNVKKCSDTPSIGLTEPLEDAAVLRITTLSSNFIKVDSEKIEIEGGIIQLLNSNGTLIEEATITNGNTTISTANIPDNLFIIRVITHDGKQHVQKFFKK